MAIYSLHHGSIGKSTHRPGTAAAHFRYITRESACSKFLGTPPAGVLLDRVHVEQWLREAEKMDRANARVVDKLTVALPRELDEEQRVRLVTEFCGVITASKVPWFATIHDLNDDAENPHAHIIIRDRGFDTGARCLGTSSKGSTELFRLAWERSANDGLSLAGHDARIDRRSHRERGLPFAPTTHLGAAERLEAKGVSTVKGDLNRRIIKANKALAEAIEIVQESERNVGRLRTRLPLSICSLDDRSYDGRATRHLERRLTIAEFYETAIVDSDLARYWRIEHVADGLRFFNKNGAFTDRGDVLLGEEGNDAEITAMLAVARLKGWATLSITGTHDFKRRATSAAKAAGFTVDQPAPKVVADLQDRLRDATARTRRARGL